MLFNTSEAVPVDAVRKLALEVSEQFYGESRIEPAFFQFRLVVPTKLLAFVSRKVIFVDLNRRFLGKLDSYVCHIVGELDH